MKKRCKEIIDLATEYLEGDMEDKTKQTFETHLEACPPCVIFFRTFRSVGSLCRKSIAKKLPPEVQASLWQFLEKRINNEE